MNELITINEVRGYCQEGTVYINLEDAARGLGFTQEKDGKEYVRWETVGRYLEEFNYKYPLDSSQLLGKTEFIPENIFYRLAMKAKNETAEIFQAKVADEILPTIRKTGTYSIQAQTIEDLIILQAQSMKDLKSKVHQLESTTQTIKDTIITQPDNWRHDLNKMFNRIVESTNEKKFQEIRHESYTLLEQRARVNLTARLDNFKTRLVKEGAGKTKVNQACKLDIIEVDAKLREIYASIIKEYTIKYCA